jgi:hypothetical protein
MLPAAMGSAGACLLRDAVRELGRRRVRTALDTRAVLSPWPGVLVDPARAAETLTVVTAAWLSTGRNSVIAGETAAFLHGYTAAEPLPVHVMVPYESHKSVRAGIVVHNGLRLADDQVLLHGLPVLGLERVLSDIACTTRPPTALAILDQALKSVEEAVREAFRDRIRDRLRHRPDPRGTSIGARLIDIATGKAESPAESWLRWRIVDMGFPVPEVNFEICNLDGKLLYRIDLSWPSLRIAVEYNGYAAHVEQPEEDAARIRDLERRGWIVVVITADDLASTSRFEQELTDAFRRRGVDVRDRTAGVLRPRKHRDRQAG